MPKVTPGILSAGPKGPPIRTYQIRSAIASTISGVTRIRKTSARKRIDHRPLRLASAMPAAVPRMVAMSAVPEATTIDVLMASMIVGSVVPVRYPSRPTPSNVRIDRPLLNE